MTLSSTRLYSKRSRLPSISSSPLYSFTIWHFSANSASDSSLNKSASLKISSFRGKEGFGKPIEWLEPSTLSSLRETRDSSSWGLLGLGSGPSLDTLA